MHISMFYGEPEDYIQIVCHQERYQERLRAIGFRDTPEELQGAQPDEMEEKLKLKGFVFDKITPALNFVHGAETKEQVEKFILDNFGVDIDKRGSLETVKDKALAVINESGRSDS